MNRQPWAFVVIQDPKVLKKICQQAKDLLMKSALWKEHSEHAKEPFLGASFDIFYDATTLVTICAEKAGFQPVGDCYLAAENLMLAATAMGLGTCPIGFVRDVLQLDEFRTELAIPESYDPVLPIIVGYPANLTAGTSRNPPRIFKWLS